MELADAAAAWLRDGFVVLPGYLAYSTDTFHWGTEITAPRSARYSAHVSYKHADNLWTGRHAWGDRSFHPDWNPFVEQASIRQLALFGFPAGPPLLDAADRRPAHRPVPGPRHAGMARLGVHARALACRSEPPPAVQNGVGMWWSGRFGST